MTDKTKIGKYFTYDINQGGWRELPKSLLLIAITLLVILQADKYIQTLIEYGYCEKYGTFLDYLAYFFQGDYVYELSASSVFVLPIYWLAFHAFVAYIVGFYPYEDFVQYGRMSILYGKDRVSWWLAKILWQILSVAWCYLLVYGTIAGYIICKHRLLSWKLTEEIWNNLSPELLNYTTTDLIVVIVILPVLTTIAITVIQGVVAFWKTPVVSFMLVNAMLVVSVYSTSYLWLGNYTMWLRNDRISPEGISPVIAILIDGVLIVIFLIIGIRQFKRVDFLGKVDGL